MSAREVSRRRKQELARQQEVEAKVLAAFNGDIEPVEVSWPYRLGILLVTVVMVLLPLLYLVLIALICYGVYYHALNHTWLLDTSDDRRGGVAIMLYATPIFAAPVVVAFMLKPIFSRPAQQPSHRSLQRDDEPLLFAFVDRICQAVGSARPQRIDIDWQVNASASFRRGLLSFLGNDLVLTIGLPLVAGTNMRELGGVLAHEFGHFSQGVGMRLTYVIRTISHWFTRAVYERDSWDQKLASWADADTWLSWFFMASQGFVWVTRRVLWVLMMAGHAVSGFMLRQMEFDADLHETRLAGSDSFESTARQLTLLNVGFQGAQDDLESFYDEGRLADNVPALIMSNVAQLPADVRKKIDKMIDESETSWLDTHPCDRDRITRAREEDATGIFRVTAPAAALFANFTWSSQQVTCDYYTMVFGEKPSPEMLHPVDTLVSRRNDEQESFEALARYLQDGFSTLRPLRLPVKKIAAVSDPAAAAAKLKQSRTAMLKAWPKYRAAHDAFYRADLRSLCAHQAMSLLSADMTVTASQFDEPLATVDQVRAVQASAAQQRNKLDAGMIEIERNARQRLWTAILLLYTPRVSDKIEQAQQWRAECEQILPALNVVDQLQDRLVTLRMTLSRLGTLLAQISDNEEYEPLIKAVRAEMAATAGLVSDANNALAKARYPFDHAKGEITIAQYALSSLPDAENPGELYEAADRLVNAMPRLRARMIGRLCVFAEAVESRLGLKPLPTPKRDEESKSGNAG